MAKDGKTVEVGLCTHLHDPLCTLEAAQTDTAQVPYQMEVLGKYGCNVCPAGTADDDSDSATPCKSCLAGHFTAEGAVTCALCGAGENDARVYLTLGSYSKEVALPVDSM